MHPTNASSSSKSSLAPPSTLRPRTRRLISIDDELNNAPTTESGASPFDSRTASPVPSSHPSRSHDGSGLSSFTRSASSQAPRVGQDSSATRSGLWGTSWSAIQDLATNVLGSEAAPGDAATRKRRPLSAIHRRTTSSAPPPKQWGPSGSAASQIGAGSQEERESMVRAMKRRDLLSAEDHVVADSIGRIKRRNSDDLTSSSAPPGESSDRDALVYIHRVRPQDTLAGITIKFNCQPAILRKANRMWPNDSVQTKDYLVVPVDACSVKGRRVSGPNGHHEDLLLGDYGDSSPNTASTSSTLPNGWGSPTRDHPESSSSRSTADTETPWTHDSWVLLPNDTIPTEIGRMPRRALGFFPPARRKSITYSDTSPRASLDLPRSSISSNRTASQTHSPKQPSSSVRPLTRGGSISGPAGRQRSASNNFRLHGPGGVGTMGRNVKSPGPGQDGLNKLFASHLPSVAPPPDQEYFTPWAPSLLDVDSGTSGQQVGSGSRTPLGGASLDLQEIGGAIEGWVRKVGSQAGKLLHEPGTPGKGKRSAVPVIGAVGGDLGDLIELQDDPFEIGDGESRGRSREDNNRTPTAEQYQSARPNLNLVLRDRRKGGVDSKTD